MQLERQIWVSKADLSEYLRCPYRLYIAYTEGIRSYDMITSRFRRAIIDEGRTYEKSEFDTIEWRRVEKNLQEILRERKSKAIKQPKLIDGNRFLFGIPDILMLHERQYLPLEIKLHRKPTKWDRLELAFYGTLLQNYTGHAVTQGLLSIPPDGLRKPLLIDIEKEVNLEISELIQKVRVAKAEALLPAIKNKECYSCKYYKTRCLVTLTQRHDLTLLPEVGPKVRDQLNEIGIKTIDDLAQFEGSFGKETLERMRYASRAFVMNQAILRMAYPLPSPKAVELSVDIEYDTFVTRRIWLISLAIRRNDRVESELFWAENESQELSELKRFIERIAKIEDDYEVYGYNCNSFDFPNLRKVTSQKGLDTKPIDVLSQKSLDLYLYLKENVSFPFKRLTLKKIIEFIAPERKPIIDSGVEATMQYLDYLKTMDESNKERLLAYARKDAEDLFVLLDWLRLKSKEVGLAFHERFNPSKEDLTHLQNSFMTHGRVKSSYRKEYGTLDHTVLIHTKNIEEAEKLIETLHRFGFKGSLTRKRGKIGGVAVYGNHSSKRFLTMIGRTDLAKLISLR
jgi:predicted RecB family nuclease